jgi:hypothetical protein
MLEGIHTQTPTYFVFRYDDPFEDHDLPPCIANENKPKVRLEGLSSYQVIVVPYILENR